jgi:hypothetical protein
MRAGTARAGRSRPLSPRGAVPLPVVAEADASLPPKSTIRRALRRRPACAEPGRRPGRRPQGPGGGRPIPRCLPARIPALPPKRTTQLRAASYAIACGCARKVRPRSSWSKRRRPTPTSRRGSNFRRAPEEHDCDRAPRRRPWRANTSATAPTRSLDPAGAVPFPRCREVVPRISAEEDHTPRRRRTPWHGRTGAGCERRPTLPAAAASQRTGGRSKRAWREEDDGGGLHRANHRSRGIRGHGHVVTEPPPRFRKPSGRYGQQSKANKYPRWHCMSFPGTMQIP